MEKGCPKCGRMIDASFVECPYCNFDFKQIDNFFEKVDMDKFLREEKYAGFIKRFVSGMIDISLTSFLVYGILYLLGMYFKFNFYLIFGLLFVFLFILGNAILERTSWHGSVGKRIVGIEVFDRYENPLTFGASLIRNTVKFVNVLTLGFGMIMCLSSESRQTLGDLITKNYVLSRVNFNEIENMGYAGGFRRFLAFLIDVLVVALVISVLMNLPLIFSYLNIEMPIFISNYLSSIVIIISLVIVFFYIPFGESRKGKTFGKKVMKIRVCSEDGEDLSFPICFVRQFLILVDLITFGWALPFSNKKRQTIKDIITNTVVICE